VLGAASSSDLFDGIGVVMVRSSEADILSNVVHDCCSSSRDKNA
jgi:hypothetical protein